MQHTKKGRIHFIDELRGFAILCMIFYHTFFTMAFLFSFNSGLKLLAFFMPFEPYFAGIFILISGISSQLSHSNIKRGLILLLIASLITVVTFIFLPDVKILFGILHMLSISIIFFGVFKPFFDLIPTTPGLLLSAVFYIFTMNIREGYLGILNIAFITIPNILYKTQYLFPIGITNSTFFSSDYFPLFPWIFLFLFGTFLGRYAKMGLFPEFMYKRKSKFFSFLGTHSLLIYIVHQPIIYIILWIFGLIF